VDFFNGHWYATSYFCPTYAGNQNCDENKFIRFRTWLDLKEGTCIISVSSFPARA